MDDKKSKIINQPLSIIMGDAFGRYAKYIIQDRALPDARDGLKPVQRRILYAMYELGLTSDKSYKKSARTVGEVIGKYHPHGDSSIYEAMVRMSQDWKNNLPLLDMHGNNGSIDGDSAAAMRYTESKLSEVANLMIGDIKKDTVEFAFNFDDSEKEPTVLPALLPNLLINGAMGIAAGYATNIPTHNPTEVFNAIIHLIDHPNTSLDNIMKIIPAPDFPTGGIIQGKSGVRDSFETGRGKFIISSKIDVNYDNKKFNQLIISEIPYDTSKATIIKELNDILFDEKVGGILEVRDESDKNGVNIVIDVKKDKNIEQVKNYLLKNTHLQVNYSTNFVAIVDRKPVLLSISDALKYYIKHALDIQYKTAQFDLNKATKRLEIVNGLILAVNNIDEVIRIIRSSDSKESAKQGLITRFGITENQAEAIVVLRLYRLSKTDIGELLDEANRLSETISNLQTLLSSEELQKQWLKKHMREYRDKYGYPRKTQIVDEINKLDINESEMIEVKELGVLVSRDGYIKVVSKKVLETNKYSDLANKQFDLVFSVNTALSNQTLLIVTQQAKTLALPLYKLKNSKWKDIGEHMNTFMTTSPNDKIVFAKVIDSISKNDGLILFTKNGLNKIVSLEDAFNTKQIKASSCFKLKDNDLLLNVHFVNLKQDYFVTLLNNNGVGYTFSSAEIPILSKTASGVKSIKLKPNESLLSVNISMTLQPSMLIIANTGIKIIRLNDFKVSSRSSIGKQIFDKNSKDNLINSFIVDKNSVFNVVDEQNQLRTFNVSDYNVDLVKFIKLNDISDILDASINNYLSLEVKEDVSKASILPKKREETQQEDNHEQLSIF